MADYWEDQEPIAWMNERSPRQPAREAVSADQRCIYCNRSAEEALSICPQVAALKAPCKPLARETVSADTPGLVPHPDCPVCSGSPTGSVVQHGSVAGASEDVSK